MNLVPVGPYLKLLNPVRKTAKNGIATKTPTCLPAGRDTKVHKALIFRGLIFVQLGVLVPWWQKYIFRSGLILL